jgi:hypothetical protein
LQQSAIESNRFFPLGASSIETTSTSSFGATYDNAIDFLNRRYPGSNFRRLELDKRQPSCGDLYYTNHRRVMEVPKLMNFS